MGSIKITYGDKTEVYSLEPLASAGGDAPIATTDTAGLVKPDGETITVTEDGTISVGMTQINNIVTDTLNTEV